MSAGEMALAGAETEHTLSIPTTPCVLYPGRLNHGGYGRRRYQGKQMLTHR
jgi:hypothetical protein